MALFANVPKGRKTGEITPLYSALPAEGIDHVKRLLPDVPVIYMVRDPLRQAISSLRMMAGFQVHRDAETVLKDPLFWARLDYQSNVARWDSAYGDKLLYLPFGDVREAPGSIMAKVEQHLGLTPFDGYEDLEKVVNSSQSKDRLVTDEMRERMRERLAPQYDFIRDRFGAEFADRIS